MAEKLCIKYGSGGGTSKDYKVGLINFVYSYAPDIYVSQVGTQTYTTVVEVDCDDTTCSKTVKSLDLSEWDYLEANFIQLIYGVVYAIKTTRIKISDFHDGDTLTVSETGFGQYGTVTRNSNYSVTTYCDATTTCVFKLYKFL